MTNPEFDYSDSDLGLELDLGEDETLATVFPGLEFYFDPNQRMFIVGKGDQTTTHSPTEMSSPTAILFDRKPDHSEPTNEDFLMLVFNGVVVLPRLRQRLVEITADPAQAQKVIKATNAAMTQVFKALRPDVELPKPRRGASPFFFNTAFPFGEGKFVLNTFGNCACLGPYPESSAVWIPYALRNDESKQMDLPVGYGPHNIDFPGQTASLLAGAGTLAWIARNGLDQ